MSALNFRQRPGQLVQGKAHLHYKIGGQSYDLTLYPKDFQKIG